MIFNQNKIKKYLSSFNDNALQYSNAKKKYNQNNARN